MSYAEGTLVVMDHANNAILLGRKGYVLANYLGNNGEAMLALVIDGNTIVTDIYQWEVQAVYVPKHIPGDIPVLWDDAGIEALYAIERIQAEHREAVLRARGEMV